MPSENPNLDERGLIITDFVDRVGDPVGIVAADGSIAPAPRCCSPTRCGRCCYAVPAGQTAGGAGRGDLSRALAAGGGRRRCATRWPRCREFGAPTPAPLVSDAAAALTALQRDPGVPTRGVIALCDFGGTGTSITLVDAGTRLRTAGADRAPHRSLRRPRSTRPCSPTSRRSVGGGIRRPVPARRRSVRSPAAGTVPRAPRSGCPPPRSTSLTADLPGHRGEVRLTRTELDDVIRAAARRIRRCTAGHAGAQRSSLNWSPSRRSAVERAHPDHHHDAVRAFRVPVITGAQPELAAAIGAGLAAVRGTVEDGSTAMAAAAPAGAAAASLRRRWRQKWLAPDEAARRARSARWHGRTPSDVPDVAPTDPTTTTRPPIRWHRRRPAADRFPARPASGRARGGAAALVPPARDRDGRWRGRGARLRWPRPLCSSCAPATRRRRLRRPPHPHRRRRTSAAPPPPSETQAPSPETVTQEAPPPPVTEHGHRRPRPEPPPPPPETTEPPPPTTLAADDRLTAAAEPLRRRRRPSRRCRTRPFPVCRSFRTRYRQPAP